MFDKLKLPPYAGMHEAVRKDGSYGYICNACGYPVNDHDNYCSKCGANVSDTLFYYGKYRKIDYKAERTAFKELFIEYDKVLSKEDDNENARNAFFIN